MSRFVPTPNLALVWILATVLGCGATDREERPQLAPQDPLWSSYISHHTSGSISRRDKIRIMFAGDVVSDEMVGQPAGRVISIDPEIDGSITFASTNELLVVPARDLPQGRTYRVSVNGTGLSGIPEGLDRYEFLVDVMTQDFEVGIVGLSPDPDDDSSMVLQGTLVTADVEDADRIERVVQANFMNRAVPVVWQHDNDGRHHEFSLAAIRRQAENQSLVLAWDGEVIDVGTRGDQVVEVPAFDVFAVTRMAAVQDARQYILVQFSGNLDRRQNVRGLVSLSGDHTFTTSIEGNQLRIMPNQRLVGRVTVALEPGIAGEGGRSLTARAERVVTFASDEPGVRFAGSGVVLPENDILTVPIEAINVHSVQVTAMRIYETNIGQFLQSNTLDGSSELDRVGRYLWRRTIPLTSLAVNEWNRYTLDLTDLVRGHPGGMFQLALSINRGNSSYNCTEDENAVPVLAEPQLRSRDDFNANDFSSWAYAEDYFGMGAVNWSERNDPCKDSYYRLSDNARDTRNFLASNLGILVKRDQRGGTMVVTTDLRTARPEPGVLVTYMNFQHQAIGTVTTGTEGIGVVNLDGVPFYAVAEKGDDRGYLRLSAGSALPTSHFDVGGATVTAGLKGFIYGERGVWRPGDEIHLTFVLEDQSAGVPDNHPVSMQLFNPQGQLIQSATNRRPTNGFYTFTMRTDDDAPTGNWVATADVGGSRFSKTLKIETVIPNRLRVDLELGGGEVLSGSGALQASLFAQWLNGAVAGNLNADVEVRMTPRPTTFDRFNDFTFDDPARDFEGEPRSLFAGMLDGSGRATFETDLAPGSTAPGMLTANFTSRVFERGGGFSTNRRTATYSPYDNYIGIRLPPGDAARGMLLTDSVHTVQIASLSEDGEPVSVDDIAITLYKVEWKWWWDRSGESLAQYASSQHRAVVERGTAGTVDGRGTWQFSIAYPAWGRYLLRACDLDGGHCTGKVFYIDWPGWAGRPQEDGSAGASVLTFFADRDEYSVGEIAQIQLPEATQGRALVSIENGTRILEQRWLEFGEGRTRFEVPITAAMSPNVYVSATLIQPHAGRSNDRPIRLYGVIPLRVSDPATRLTPVITAPDEWRPESRVTVRVSEAANRRMTYTLAVVDEGLLGLTSYNAPELHDHFYAKEALGVTTWDLFDEVAGAYGGELERLLALGGSGEADEIVGQQDQNRFPPVVRFLGPFTLASGRENTHEIDLPQYIGAVRVMVVAGEDGAYGTASRSVFVREPLSLLATLPRVVGPGEDLTVPVTVFAMDPSIQNATIRVETDDHFEVVGEASTRVAFAGAGEQLGFLRLRVGSTLGQGSLRFIATGGQFSAQSDIALSVRSPNPETVNQWRAEIAPGESWESRVTPHGLAGTNSVSLEVTTLPPINLEGRLRYLIRYPHGCVEQITSAAFPQIYLRSLVSLDPNQRAEIDENVQAAIDRLRGFQVPTGAFVYWPGGFAAGGVWDNRNAWATNYVGHFLVEAQRAGYNVPPAMLSDWINHQRMTAQSWVAGPREKYPMDQAYRLYTLALADRAEMGAMNRLRESRGLDTTTRWLLAAAYRLAGLPDIAGDLIRNESINVASYDAPGWSLGSRLRDLAIVLNGLVTLDIRGDAQTVAQEISDELTSDNWHSTHAVAFALMAMARFYGVGNVGASFTFDRRIGVVDVESVTTSSPIYSSTLTDFPDAGQNVSITNTSNRPLYGTIVVRGIPAAGTETSVTAGLRVVVDYTDPSGNPVNVANMTLGTDFVARVSVTNRTRTDLDNLALEHMVPAGWEIHNTRLDGAKSTTAPDIEYEDIRDDRVYTYFALDAGETKTFVTLLNAAYIGRYYLPGIAVEAMYDATRHGRTNGEWVLVTR